MRLIMTKTIAKKKDTNVAGGTWAPHRPRREGLPVERLSSPKPRFDSTPARRCYLNGHFASATGQIFW